MSATVTPKSRIVVTANRWDKLADLLNRHSAGGAVHAVFDPNVYALHRKTLERLFRRCSTKVNILVWTGGEKHKNLREADRVCEALISGGLTRDDLVLAIGGGVTTDVIGFAASMALRGIRWAACPTTLLGMVDAAIGGKTGVNSPLGKNLLGSFWHPTFVWCETEFLNTLPSRELVAGLGEIVKYAGLKGGPLIKKTSRIVRALRDGKPTRVTALIRECATLKSEIVAGDPRESGRRAVLNLGHTFAHAIERGSGYGRVLHGEAVIIGQLMALELGECLGYDDHELGQYRELVETAAMLVSYRDYDVGVLLDAMVTDKKRNASGLRFVLIEKPGRPIITQGVSRRDLRRAVSRGLKRHKEVAGA